MDYKRNDLFDKLGIQRLREGYLLDDMDPQELLYKISYRYGTNNEHSQRLYEYSSNHWLSYSTPILAILKNKGLPVSCYVNYVDDTRAGLIDNLSESSWLTTFGGGVGIQFANRPIDKKSTGVIAHMKIYDASVCAFQQGTTRRGAYAAYLNINHPEIVSFLDIRKPTGDPALRCHKLHHGVNITDDFMNIIDKCERIPYYDDRWLLQHPKNNQRTFVSAKSLWQQIIQNRITTGEPFIHFSDTSNRALPLSLKDKTIHCPNLCCEILQPFDKDHTVVCVLSSLNLAYYDQWKDNKLFIRDVAEMLDNVMEDFIQRAPDTIIRAKRSAIQQRNIGIGTMGFHSYLQDHNIPWHEAKGLNKSIFQHIQQEIGIANIQLAYERGSAPLAKDQRFCLTTAIAPNASTSIIMGNTSPSIEPYRANCYRHDTLSGLHYVVNPKLNQLLLYEAENKPDDWLTKTWNSIIDNNGSVHSLSCLTSRQRDVFKTAMEIKQDQIVQYAIDRQPFIDQGQSLNLFITTDVDPLYLHKLHLNAWKGGLKTLYYCRSEKITKTNIPSELECIHCSD